MTRIRTTGVGLVQLALKRAEEELSQGKPEAALAWLEAVPPGGRPQELEAAARYALAKVALASGECGRCERELAEAQRLDPQFLFQARLELIRRREPLLEIERWQHLREKVDRAKRLSLDLLNPAVSSVWSCGAYHSRGHSSAMPWSRLLRLAKDPPPDPEERATILSVARGFLCRFVVEETALLRDVDIVVAIPPDPERYAQRGMSLPDELAEGAKRQLTLPWPKQALVRKSSIELRGLTRSERRRAVRGSMATDDANLLKDRCVLLVDDVITSGATLREAAEVVRAAGASVVHAITLCHTEG